jgi:hypothetical protein
MMYSCMYGFSRSQEDHITTPPAPKQQPHRSMRMRALPPCCWRSRSRYGVVAGFVCVCPGWRAPRPPPRAVACPYASVHHLTLKPVVTRPSGSSVPPSATACSFFSAKTWPLYIVAALQPHRRQSQVSPCAKARWGYELGWLAARLPRDAAPRPLT